MTLRGKLSNITSNPVSKHAASSGNDDGGPPPGYQQRHGSAESYRSTDTVRGPGKDAKGTAVGKLKSGERSR